ncbi:ras and EF-hand domain-containing protein-like [Grus japonensis]|uniref:Ras and EF-hand domain-containing protein-like n=1 Tax=Grus japonensis TaxID=30415 RepID=A0ABC9XB32_GRUJA
MLGQVLLWQQPHGLAITAPAAGLAQPHSSDTPGPRYRSIAQSYFHKAHGVLLLYDISSPSSFLSVRQWIEDIKATERPLPLMLVGNKMDLRPGLPEAAGVHTAHGQQLAMAHSSLFCETSAKDGTNVVEAVLHLAR